MEHSKEPEQLHELHHVAPNLRTIAEALIGSCEANIPERLKRAAKVADKAGKDFSQFKPIAKEFSSFANALSVTDIPPSFDRFSELLKVPISKSFLTEIPEEYREDWKILNRQLDHAKEQISLFTAASRMQLISPSKSRDIALRLRGDELLADDIQLLTHNASRVTEAALLQTGFSLLAVSRILDRMIDVIIPLLLVCADSDECELDRIRDCEAGDFYFIPYEDKPGDDEDFETAVDILQGVGWLLPAKYLSPGGKKMIREIADMLERIKQRVDKKKIDLEGYGVYVVLNYQKCVDGMCGNYWDSKSKIVMIDPPQGKSHLNSNGWKAKVIENLGKDESDTEDQLREFKELAERQCP